MGTLYIVATPIGNLEDITVRAAKLLTSIGVIVCEDTRHTGILLSHLRKTYLDNPQAAARPQLLSFYEENEEQKIPGLIAMLKDGYDVALVTDAGTPGISDPGFTLTRECKKQGIPVVGLPGASAATLALVVSGLPTDKFTFLGFLPKKPSHAKTILENIKKMQGIIKVTYIFFESPHKLVVNLALIKDVLGDIHVVLCRELTKIHEEVLQGSISEMIEKYTTLKPKGEIVLLFHQ